MTLKRRVKKLEKYAPPTGDYEMYLTHDDFITGKVSKVSKEYYDERMARLNELAPEADSLLEKNK